MEFLNQLSPFVENVGFPALIFAIWYIYHQSQVARKLMSGIISDMEAGEKIDPGRMYTFCKIIPMFTKVKNYEDLVAKKEEKATPKGLTPELIAQIEEEILGITHNDDINETK